MPFVFTCSGYCIPKWNVYLLECLSPKKILKNAKLTNEKRLTDLTDKNIYFSNFECEKNDFYTRKIGDYLEMRPHYRMLNYG